MVYNHSTKVPEGIFNKLKQVAGKEGVGTVAARILMTFRGRILQEVVRNFPKVEASLGVPWVRVAMVLPQEMEAEIVAADEACPPLQRMHLVGVLLTVHADDLERLAAGGQEGEADAPRETEAAVTQ